VINVPTEQATLAPCGLPVAEDVSEISVGAPTAIPMSAEASIQDSVAADSEVVSVSIMTAVHAPATSATDLCATTSMKKVIHLKNARVNEPYVGLIDDRGVRVLKVLDDDGTGLELDESGRQLLGTFTRAGDFVIKLEGKVGHQRCELFANVAAIPDPRSLWVSRESDQTAPFWKPDAESARINSRLLCIAASKRGRSHAKDGLFRDDDFALWSGGVDDWHIAVVADGAGSAKFSRRGSRIAVSHIAKELPGLLDEHLTPNLDRLVAAQQSGAAGAVVQIKSALYLSMVSSAFDAAKAIVEDARKHSEKATAFRTTIVLTVARYTPQGWFIAGFSIGDGGAAIFDHAEGTVMPLSLADGGEFAGQTRFLETSEFNGGFEELAKRLFFDVRPSFTAILAMTDGITDPKFPTDSVFANPGAWMKFWDEDLTRAVHLEPDNPDIEAELLAWLDFWSPGNHDDRTLAIMLANDSRKQSNRETEA
jgi:hypothetical protein